MISLLNAQLAFTFNNDALIINTFYIEVSFIENHEYLFYTKAHQRILVRIMFSFQVQINAQPAPHGCFLHCFRMLANIQYIFTVSCIASECLQTCSISSLFLALLQNACKHKVYLRCFLHCFRMLANIQYIFTVSSVSIMQR